MSRCEKCWRDAHRDGPFADVAAVYARLIDERKDHPCTPEEQAGGAAQVCPACGHTTLHQLTRECMVHGCRGTRG